jgi:hypothetical protein
VSVRAYQSCDHRSSGSLEPSHSPEIIGVRNRSSRCPHAERSPRASSESHLTSPLPLELGEHQSESSVPGGECSTRASGAFRCGGVLRSMARSAGRPCRLLPQADHRCENRRSHGSRPAGTGRGDRARPGRVREGFSLYLDALFEVGAENRPQGRKFVLRLSKLF